MRGRKRGLILVAVTVVSLTGASVYVAAAALKARKIAHIADNTKAQAVPLAFSVAAVTSQKPYIVFRHIDADDPYTYGRVALAPVDEIQNGTVVTKLQCSRVYFSGARGVCLDIARNFGVAKQGWILGPDLSQIRTFSIFGRPTRTRISRDGKLVAATVFSPGGAHSYAVTGTFITATTLIDVPTGKTVANLEQFKITRDGKPFKKSDFNFWGVTFANDHNRFYATLASGGKTYLVAGNMKTRTIKTMFTNVECPSLSPDQTRIAYKRRTGGPGVWRLSVLDLRTGKVTPLAEKASVDDQAEWLDNSHVLYSRDSNVYSVNADGTGTPKLFIANADSPAVVR